MGGGFSDRRLPSLIRVQAEKFAPGLIDILDLQSTRRYGKSLLSLLESNPSRLYELVVEFAGDQAVADSIMKYVFLRPLSVASGGGLDPDFLLHLVKRGRDDVFVSLMGALRPY